MKSLTIGYLALLLLSLPLYGTDRQSYMQQLEDSRQEADQLGQSLKNDKLKHEELQTRLKQNKNKISRLKSKILSLEKQINQNNADLKQLEADLVIQRRNARLHKDRLAEQLRAAYQMGRQTEIQLILSQDDPTTFSRMSVYSDYYSQARKRRISSALYSVRKLTKTHLLVAQKRNTLKSGKQKLSESIKAQNQEQQTREVLLAQLNSGISSKIKENQ